MKTLLSNAWLQRDLGFLYWVADQADARGCWGAWGLSSWARRDDLLYLKEQMEAEEDAERLLRRTEKRAFAAFKRAASLADSSPASVPLAFRVEPKPKSGIRQQDLLKKVVEIKPKRLRSDGNQSSPASSNAPVTNHKTDNDPLKEKEQSLSGPKKAEEHPQLGSLEAEAKAKVENPGGGLLGLAYASSDDDE
ncbi:uncharacterized protein LOC113867464 isoform X2 [Abrus precatorius]|uniref:Uncharacterized protein LOC113867464 isoform X2 n=1 Tax=Abrus precatorius TaxID=3816 RepID=A0A8B8LUP7_ABRPR|nr:uncharacterized protein LOC113867464 isoform X2 [Abrus precatorius]